MSSHPRVPVICPDCGAVGLPVRAPEYDRPDLPHVVRCRDCMAVIDVAPRATLSELERATGVRANTYRAHLGIEGPTLAHMEASLTSIGAEAIVISRDVHGAIVLRHSARGTFRASNIRDAFLALEGDVTLRPHVAPRVV